MNLSVKIKGVKKVRTSLRRYESKSANQVRKVITKTTLSIESGAKRYCPVRTGRLRAGNRSEFSDGGFTGRVKNNTEYALHVELGARNQRAQPFMRPAFHDGTRNFENDIKRAL